jgi:hypothetical protein
VPIISEIISGLSINLPDDLPAPKSRKALEHGRAAKSAREKAFTQRDVAIDLRWKLDQQIAIEHGAILDERPDAVLPDGGKLVAKAQRLVEDTQRDLDARVEAERRAAVKIRAAVLEEIPLLVNASLAEADTALAMLSAVIEDAELARDALYSSVGVAGMCSRLGVDEGAPLSIQHKAYGYTFSIGAAIEGLYEALKRASDELDELRAGFKPERKARTPRKAASEAHSAAPAVSESEAEVAFQIESDDDA